MKKSSQFCSALLLATVASTAFASQNASYPPGQDGQECNIGVESRGCNSHAGSIKWEVDGASYTAGACSYHESKCTSLLRELRRQVKACYGEDVKIKASAFACEDRYE